MKQSEMRTLECRADGSLDADVIDPLRKLFDECKNADGAEDSVCYHGAFALILEFDGDFHSAIEHRNIEIAKILELHELARVNPGGRPALKDYGEQELQYRYRILDELLRKAIGG
jgi:hypothetical protein